MNPTPSQPERPEPQFPILRCPEIRSIPWSLIAPHENQAQENHFQTLARLAERGGLSPAEAVAVLEDRPWASMNKETAIQMLNRIVATRTPAPEAEQFQKGGDESCRTIPDATTPVLSTDGVAEGRPVPNVRSNAPAAVLSGSQGQAPEAVAGERKPEVSSADLLSAWLLLGGLNRPFGEFEEHYRKGGDTWLRRVLIERSNQSPTPPVEADKDAEIARLRKQVLSEENLKTIGHSLMITGRLGCGPEKTAEEVIARVDAVLAAESDLTTARATIAERDKRIAELVGALNEANDALRANQVFHTPIALSRKTDRQWDEYEADAINRTKQALAHAAEGKEQA